MKHSQGQIGPVIGGDDGGGDRQSQTLLGKVEEEKEPRKFDDLFDDKGNLK